MKSSQMRNSPFLGPLPPCVNDDEEMARAVYSKSHFRSQQGNEPAKVKFGAYLPEKDREKQEEHLGSRLRDISVDRLSYLTVEEATELAKERNRVGSFRGWAVILAGRVEGNGRDVKATPTKASLAHADIILPTSTITSDEERKEHLVELAERSCWLGASNSSAGNS